MMDSLDIIASCCLEIGILTRVFKGPMVLWLPYPIFGLCTYFMMVNSAYFVKSTPPRAFSISILYLAGMLQTYYRCA